jgi:hypothetical protein
MPGGFVPGGAARGNVACHLPGWLPGVVAGRLTASARNIARSETVCGIRWYMVPQGEPGGNLANTPGRRAAWYLAHDRGS